MTDKEPLKGPLPEERPLKVQPRIIAAPKVKQMYWCDFWLDSHLPEFWKTRPVIVMSYKNSLYGPCTIVPTSSEAQDGNPWAFKLTSSIDGRDSWAICNQPSTVAPSRLSQSKGAIPLVAKAEFNEVLARLTRWLPIPFTLE